MNLVFIVFSLFYFSTPICAMTRQLSKYQPKYQFTGLGINKPCPLKIPTQTVLNATEADKPEPTMDYLGKIRGPNDIAIVTQGGPIFYVDKKLAQQSLTIAHQLEEFPDQALIISIKPNDFYVVYSLLQQSLKQEAKHYNPEHWRQDWWQMSLPNLIKSSQLNEYFDIKNIRDYILERLTKYAIQALIKGNKSYQELLNTLYPNIQQTIIKNILPQILGEFITILPLRPLNLPTQVFNNGDLYIDDSITVDYAFSEYNWGDSIIHLTQFERTVTIPIHDDQIHKILFRRSGINVYGISDYSIYLASAKDIHHRTRNYRRLASYDDRITAFAEGLNGFTISIGFENGNVIIDKYFPSSNPLFLSSSQLIQNTINPKELYPILLCFNTNNYNLLAAIYAHHHNNTHYLSLWNLATKSSEYFVQLPQASDDILFTNDGKFLITINKDSLYVIDSTNGKEIAAKELNFNDKVRLHKDNNNIVIWTSQSRYQLNVEGLSEKSKQLSNISSFKELEEKFKDIESYSPPAIKPSFTTKVFAYFNKLRGRTT